MGSAREWREARERGFELILPSGRTAIVRPVSTMMMLRAGRIPDGMVSFVASVMQGVGGELPAMQTQEDLRMVYDFYENVCRAAFVSPKIVDEIRDEDNEILLEDLEQDDMLFVARMLNVPADSLRTFRDEQKKYVESVGDDEGNGSEGQQVDGSEEVGEGNLPAVSS